MLALALLQSLSDMKGFKLKILYVCGLTSVFMRREEAERAHFFIKCKLKDELEDKKIVQFSIQLNISISE